MDNSNGWPRRRGRRIMICVRGECALPEAGKRLETRLNFLIEQYGLDNPDHTHYTRCTITNCLAVCTDGPILIVHPDGIKYHHVDEAALERIFQDHILQDRPVRDLIVTEPRPKSFL